MEIIKTKHDIGDKDKHAIRVLEKDNFDTIHVHLKKGESLTSHHAKSDVLIVVRKGLVTFYFDDEDKEIQLTNEDVLHMDPFENHSVFAEEETDFLIIKVF